MVTTVMRHIGMRARVAGHRPVSSHFADLGAYRKPTPLRQRRELSGHLRRVLPYGTQGCVWRSGQRARAALRRPQPEWPVAELHRARSRTRCDEQTGAELLGSARPTGIERARLGRWSVGGTSHCAAGFGSTYVRVGQRSPDRDEPNPIAAPDPARR